MSKKKKKLKESRGIKNEIKRLIILEHDCKKSEHSGHIPLQIPGHKMEENLKINCKFGEIQHIPNLGLKNIYFSNLLAPTAHATLLKDDCGVSLKVLGVSFVNSSYKLVKNDFQFFYNFTCNSAGEYQLNIYMTFDRKEVKVIDYTFYPFEIDFLPGAIKCAEGTIVAMEDIKTVQLFLINRDPKTSRGTETSVQPGD